MTNGTSQGLFVVVAIIIFGIFVLISYILFKDNLKPTLANIFTDGLEQGTCNLISECPIDIVAEREDETYLYAKIREADESKGETEIWVRAEKLEDGTLKIDRSSVSDNNYSSGSAEMTGSLIMPDTINGMKIIGINSNTSNKISLANSWSHNVFYNAKFDGELKLPAYLTSIPDGVFANSKFSGELIIPKGVTIIGMAAFIVSTFSGELELPNGLTAIGDYAFENSKFSGGLKLPTGLTRVSGFDNSTFSGELILPKGVKIDLSAFYSSEFSGTLDVSNVTSIQSGAFRSSKFDKVIRGDVAMSDDSTPYNNSGIHPRSIKLANGSWYDGSNG